MIRGLLIVAAFAAYGAFLVTGTVLLKPPANLDLLTLAGIGASSGVVLGIPAAPRAQGRSNFSFLLLVILGLLGLTAVPGWIRYLFMR